MEPFILHFDAEFLKELAWQLLNTGILSFILYKLLYKPVTAFLNKRSDRFAGQLEQAARNLEDSEKTKAALEERLREIAVERGEILENARHQALKKEAQIISDARFEADQIKTRVRVEMNLEQEHARDTVRTSIIEISSLIAARYVDSVMDEKAQNRLLDEVITDLGDATWLN